MLNRKISVAAIVVLGICFQFQVMAMEDFNNPFTPDANTMALWHFDEVSGDTVAADASAYNHDGKLQANISPSYPQLDPSETWAVSKSGLGNCVLTWWNNSSDSNSGVIEVDDPNSTLNLYGLDITIEFWMNPNAAGDSNGSVIVQKHSGGAWGVTFNNNRNLIFKWNYSGWRFAQDTSAIPLNDWTHVAILVDRNSLPTSQIISFLYLIYSIQPQPG